MNDAAAPEQEEDCQSTALLTAKEQQNSAAQPALQDTICICHVQHVTTSNRPHIGLHSHGHLLQQSRIAGQRSMPLHGHTTFVGFGGRHINTLSQQEIFLLSSQAHAHPGLWPFGHADQVGDVACRSASAEIPWL